jgi:hypothetical protein
MARRKPEEDPEDESDPQEPDEDGPEGPDDDEEDEEDDEEPDKPAETDPPDHPDVRDLTEQLEAAKAEAEERARALEEREARLRELEERHNRTQQELIRTRGALVVATGAGDVAEEVAKATAGKLSGSSAPPPSAPSAPSRQPGVPPSTGTARHLPRKDRPRYAEIPEAEKVDLTENDLADIESDLKRGLRPTEALEGMGIPANRYTLDQVRSIARTLSNRGEAPGMAKPADPLSALEQLTKTIEVLSKAGLVVTRAEVDKMRDEWMGLKQEQEGEMGELRETLRVGREIVGEVVEAARDMTGHPKRGARVADELAAKNLHRRVSAGATTPALAGTSAPAAELAGPAAPTMTEEQAEATRLRTLHPEALGTVDYIMRLAPRVYDIVAVDDPPEVLAENAAKDAVATANLVWMAARNVKPSHLMDSNSGRCVRCNVANSPEVLGKPCPLAWSQKDMLRGLKGTTTRGLLEQIARFQSTIEMNTPLDTLGGLTLRQYMFTKKFGPSDDPNLGGHTIFDVVTSEVGLLWLGKFIDVITDKVIQEEQQGQQATLGPRPDAPEVPSAPARE